jgi:endonuclease/exonuclease/phosphatase (EEP) superfamily protein YafD
MQNLNIEILNPKAALLLKNLEDLKLISIKASNNSFKKLLSKIRATQQEELLLSEITKEVEAVRKQRYEKK